jgi:hypothetical protein
MDVLRHYGNRETNAAAERNELPMNNFDLNDVRTFVAVAQEGTLAAAAKKCIFRHRQSAGR